MNASRLHPNGLPRLPDLGEVLWTQEPWQTLLNGEWCWEVTEDTSLLQESPHNSKIVAVQSLSQIWFFAALWTVASQASLSFTISQSLLKLMSIESVMPSNHLILGHPLLLLPSMFPKMRVFSNDSALHIKWPKYWCLSLSISPSNEYSGLISFSWFFWSLAVQGMLKSLLEHHSSKASILQYSAFFIVQLSHPWLLEKL